MKKDILRIVAIMMLIILLLTTSVLSSASKLMGDINRDGRITATDLSMLKLHLISVRMIPQENQTYADFNNDNRITALDLSRLKMKIIGLGTDTNDLEIRSQLVQDLYSYIPRNEQDGKENGPFLTAYQSKKTTISDIDNVVKLKTALLNVKWIKGENFFAFRSDVGEKDDYGYSSIDPNKTWDNLGEVWVTFDPDTLEEVVKRIYGKDVEIQHGNIRITTSKVANYDKDRNKYDYFGSGGGGYFSALETRRIINAIKEENEIIIYDNYVYTEFEIERDDLVRVDFYKNSDKKDLMESIGNDEGMFVYNDALDEKINQHRTNTYKHTFKKKENGSYYWYSTEPMN